MRFSWITSGWPNLEIYGHRKYPSIKMGFQSIQISYETAQLTKWNSGTLTSKNLSGLSASMWPLKEIAAGLLNVGAAGNLKLLYLRLPHCTEMLETQQW